jgi:hypothetical protein
MGIFKYFYCALVFISLVISFNCGVHDYAYSPNPPAGSILGRVIDESGTPLPNVLTRVIGFNFEYVTLTNSSGKYLIEDVPTGQQRLFFRKDGYDLNDTTWVTISTENDLQNPVEPPDIVLKKENPAQVLFKYYVNDHDLPGNTIEGVYVSGDFNNWSTGFGNYNPEALMTKDNDNEWSIRIFISPGRYLYGLVIRRLGNAIDQYYPDANANYQIFNTMWLDYNSQIVVGD